MSLVFSALREHCSNHSYYMNGCSDCDLAAQYQEENNADYQYFQKAVIGVHPLEIKTGQPGLKLQLVRQQTIRKVFTFFQNSQTDVTKAIEKKSKQLNKAEKPESDVSKSIELIFLAAYSAITWSDLVEEIKLNLLEAQKTGTLDGLAQLDINAEDMISVINKEAADYASIRAAELIGKRWEAGELVDNPNAKYAISATTKDDLHDVIEQSFKEEKSIADLQKRIQTCGIFSRARAELVAKTEIAMAQYRGHIETWKKSGLIKNVNVVLSYDHRIEDLCNEFVAKNPWKIEEAPSLPLHPNCYCSVAAHKLES